MMDWQQRCYINRASLHLPGEEALYPEQFAVVISYLGIKSLNISE